MYLQLTESDKVPEPGPCGPTGLANKWGGKADSYIYMFSINSFLLKQYGIKADIALWLKYY